ncbi:hypothetical protein NL676_032223 [Syzygium grande]|nr:hypothetical protein NL676_032223 [Syzygium grande]
MFCFAGVFVAGLTGGARRCLPSEVPVREASRLAVGSFVVSYDAILGRSPPPRRGGDAGQGRGRALGLAAGEGRPPFLARFEGARRPRLGDAGVDAAGGVARAGDTCEGGPEPGLGFEE